MIQILIHKFRYRNGFYSTFACPQIIENETQFSPIFLPWLAAVF